MVDPDDSAITAYAAALSDYLETHSEAALLQASLLSHHFVESGFGPDDIIALHFEALEQKLVGLAPRDHARSVGDAHQFLLDVMIAYGVKYKEYLELRLRESLREAEARLQLEQQRALEAERAEREKNELLAGIAHELRTPLTAARGNLDLAVRSLSRGQTERLAPLLGTTREAIDRLSRLTADLVQVGRGEVPQLDFSTVDLSQVLRQACSWVEPSASAKGLRLTYATASQPVTIKGNADALLSVFGNLLSNAVRYNIPGGLVEVRHGTDGDEAWTEVRDTGIGMAPEEQQRVFQRFYRSREARQLDAHGLGLGLALVQQMVSAHQGRIEVDSVPGEGTRFRVLLPIDWEGIAVSVDEHQETLGGGKASQ